MKYLFGVGVLLVLALGMSLCNRQTPSLIEGTSRPEWVAPKKKVPPPPTADTAEALRAAKENRPSEWVPPAKNLKPAPAVPNSTPRTGAPPF